MELILDALVQLSEVALVLVLAPLLTGYVRKVKARLLRRQDRSSALSRPAATHSRSRAGSQRLVVFRVAPIWCSPPRG
jgi:hypothetical protein